VVDDSDLRTVRRRTNASGCWGNEDHRTREQRVRLNDDAVPPPPLLMTGAARRTKLEHVTAAH
jgi:hypothetical protein